MHLPELPFALHAVVTVLGLSSGIVAAAALLFSEFFPTPEDPDEGGPAFLERASVLARRARLPAIAAFLAAALLRVLEVV